ncbi:MAG: hypothetical protein PVJ57_19545 [Phycisphaerae bacterium]|jgi:hypothetical protein
MTDGPSDAQLRFLDKLGYSGEAPRTKGEASFLIDGRKAGRDSAKLEKELIRQRQKVQREWFKREREYCRAEIRQARDSEGAIAGFRIRIGKRCDSAKQYHGAFVPTQVALRYPELLPPYEGVCQYWACECEIEELLESDRLAADTPMVIRPGRITTVGKGHRKHRSLLGLLVLAAMVYAVYWLWSTDLLKTLLPR